MHHRRVLVAGVVAVAVAAAATAPSEARGDAPGTLHGIARPATARSAAVDDDWNHRRPLVISHAGGDLESPHSTIYAMRRAIEAGTDVLEMDLRLSSDGVIMIQHDDTVDRTSNATGPVSNYTAAQLQALDNAYWFVPDCWSCHDRPDAEYTLRGIRTGAVAPPSGFSPDDFGVTTLANVVATFPDRVLDVEIKDGPGGYATADALAAFIATHGPSSRYVVASFDDNILAYFKGLAPDVATSPGLSAMTEWFLARGPFPGHRVMQVPPTYGDITVVTPQFVADAHAEGIAVWVWFNGNDDDVPAVWNELLDMGVDGLVTGKPRQAEAVLEARDSVFAVAPWLTQTPPITRRGGVAIATLQAGCPTLHLAQCDSDVYVVARTEQGRWFLVGQTRVTAGRGNAVSAPMTLTPDARRRARPGRPLAAWALDFPRNRDTAPAVLPLSLG